MMSGVEPGPYGTMIRTGPLGQSAAGGAACASAVPQGDQAVGAGELQEAQK